MCIYIMNNVFKMSPEVLTNTEKSVLLVLARYANTKGIECFPGLDRIAHNSSLHPKTVSKVISQLQKKKLIIRISRNRQNPPLPNEYIIAVQLIAMMAEKSEKLPNPGNPPLPTQVTLKSNPGNARAHYRSVKNQKQRLKEDEGKSLVKTKVIIPPQILKITSGDAMKKDMPNKFKVLGSAKNVEGVYSSLKGKPTSTYTLEGKKVTPGSLIVLWRDLVPHFYPDMGMLVEFKIKEKGQFAQLIKLLPDDKLVSSVTEVLEHWVEFTNFVESSFGAKKSPLYPTIGYMLLYSQAVLSFSAQENEDLPVQSVAMKEVQDKKPIDTEATNRQDKPMTLEEFQSMEGDDG